MMHNKSLPYSDSIIEGIASYYAMPAGEMSAIRGGDRLWHGGQR